MGVAFCPSVEDALNDEDCWWWRWGSLPPLEEFAAHVVNQVHQEQIVAGERRPRTLWKSQLCRSRVTVQEIPEVQVVERIQEQIVETMYPIERGMSRIGTTRKIYSLRLPAGPRCQASWSVSTRRSADIRFKQSAESTTLQEVVRQRHVGVSFQWSRQVLSGPPARPFRLCEAPAGLSLFSQRVRTVALHEHSGANATMIDT